MLTALENGVKGGKWFSLIDKVARKEVLAAAFRRVKRNGGAPGVDRVTIEMFEAHLEENLQRLSESVLAGTYRPQAIRRREIRKHPGSREMRPLGIPTVRDRVVQTALRMVLEPIFEWDFAEGSYGFRPGRGCLDALREVERLLQAGYVWVVDADLRKFFDTLNHEILLRRIREKISDGKVLSLLELFLRQEVMEGLDGWTPEEGSPQGAVISPLLSNVYLDPLDHMMADGGFHMVRYADDFVILCQSEEEARKALTKVQGWVARVELRLHPTKTRLVDATQRGGFDFLGYHFERGYKWPSKKSLRKLRDGLRRHTKRANGHSLDEIILRVNRTLHGWYSYYRYSHWKTYRDLDGWIRGRLRSILRKRRKRRGRARGQDHQRWPNAFFSDRGLFSLLVAYESAYGAARQSSRR
jgi:RNA-directed DNA polymerase